MLKDKGKNAPASRPAASKTCLPSRSPGAVSRVGRRGRPPLRRSPPGRPGDMASTDEELVARSRAAISTASTSWWCAGSGRSTRWRIGSSAAKRTPVTSPRKPSSAPSARSAASRAGEVLVLALPDHAQSLSRLDPPRAARAGRTGSRGRRPRRAGVGGGAGRIDRGSRRAPRARSRGGQSHGDAARRAAHRNRLEGIPRPDVPGDRRSARLSAEHREDALVSGAQACCGSSWRKPESKAYSAAAPTDDAWLRRPWNDHV